MNPNPKALRLAAGILKDFSSDGQKTVALQAVLRDAAETLEKAATAS